MGTQGKIKLVAIVDDDDSMRSALQGLLKAIGLPAQAFASDHLHHRTRRHKNADAGVESRRGGVPGQTVRG